MACHHLHCRIPLFLLSYTHNPIHNQKSVRPWLLGELFIRRMETVFSKCFSIETKLWKLEGVAPERKNFKRTTASAHSYQIFKTVSRRMKSKWRPEGTTIIPNKNVEFIENSLVRLLRLRQSNLTSPTLSSYYNCRGFVRLFWARLLLQFVVITVTKTFMTFSFYWLNYFSALYLLPGPWP